MEEQTSLPASQTSISAASTNAPAAWLTYEELSERTRFSVSTLRRRVREGTIPFIQPGGRRTRIVFPFDVVERLLRAAASPSADRVPDVPPARKQRRGPRPKWQSEIYA